MMAEFEEQKHSLLQTLREEKKQEQALHKADMELMKSQFSDEQKRLEALLLNQKKQHLQEVFIKKPDLIKDGGSIGKTGDRKRAMAGNVHEKSGRRSSAKRGILHSD